MRKVDKIRMIIICLLTVFAVMSFMPCINEKGYYMIEVFDVLERDFVNKCSYLPVFCCFICVIEIMFLLFNKKRRFLIIGLLLNLVKTFFPFMRHKLAFDKLMGGLIGYEYSLRWQGYVIIGVGIIISIAYIIAFGKEKRIVAEC